MTYSFEAAADLRQELRAGVAGVVSLYPKIDGQGNVTVTSATATLFTPDGTSLGIASVSIVAQGGGSRLDVAIPSITNMAEDYRAEIVWSTVDSGDQLSSVYFDVCREPFGPSTTSLNTLQNLAPDLVDRISRQGVRLGQTAAQRASVIGHQARVELGNWLRTLVGNDVSRMQAQISTKTLRRLSLDQYLRPRLFKDRARLSDVEAKLAVSLAYRADMRAGEDFDNGADTVAGLSGQWFAAAKASFEAMGPGRYDVDDNGTVDTLIPDIGRITIQRRVQS